MGTREKLIVIYSRVGWEKLTNLIGSLTTISSLDRKHVLDVINDNDSHLVDPGGAHLLYWSECDSLCPDMQLLLSGLNSAINSREWFVYTILDNGTEDSYGGYGNSSFSPSIQRQFDWESHHAVKANVVNIPDPPAPKPVVATVVNNHKCGACGNDRCSKQEKSCWKCGNPL